MSWIGEHVTKLEEWAKDLLGHADEKVHEIGKELAQVASELRGDAPKLEAEAEQAEDDAVQLGEDAAHDVAAAVEGGPKAEPEVAAAEVPAEPTA